MIFNHILVQLEDTFRDDARETIQETPDHKDYRDAWDDAQREVRINKLNIMEW